MTVKDAAYDLAGCEHLAEFLDDEIEEAEEKGQVKIEFLVSDVMQISKLIKHYNLLLGKLEI